MKKTFKKIAATAVSLAMVFGMSFGASADDYDLLYKNYTPVPTTTPAAQNTLSDTITGSSSRVVTVAVNRADTKVYRVDVEWDSLNFTWEWNGTKDASGNVIWDPDNHCYGDGTGKWKDDKNTADIVVTNHSNDSVAYTASFSDSSTATYVAEVSGVKGTLSGEYAKILATAEDTEFTGAPAGTVNLTLSQKPDEKAPSSITLGTIYVNIAKAN